MKNIRIRIILAAVPVLLLIPFIAMQFSDEVSWTFFDFVVMGILLLGTGLMCELVLRKITSKAYIIAICLTIFAIFIIIWAELAVGIFGTPFSGH